ncbi:MAG: hypothetical protein WBP58_02995 [Chitinophagaceae bacterium]
MSEISILSAQFGELSKIVDEVNHAIILLKAQVVKSTQMQDDKVILELDEVELEQAIDFMKKFLQRLALLEHPDDHSEQLLPNEAVGQLNKTVIIEIPDFFGQLHVIQLAIEKHQVLTTSQLQLLDQVVDALDQERSELFKKLRAARG